MLRNYLTSFVEYIMSNAGLDEEQAGIKTARRNSILRYAENITLMAESEELNSLLMKVKEESEKAGLTYKKLRLWDLVLTLHSKEMGNN